MSKHKSPYIVTQRYSRVQEMDESRLLGNKKDAEICPLCSQRSARSILPTGGPWPHKMWCSSCKGCYKTALKEEGMK